MSHMGWDGDHEDPDGVQGAGDADRSAPDAAVPGKDGPSASAARPTEIDLLFMIDNSGTMAEEQRKLVAGLGDFVRVLATGQLTPDSISSKQDFVAPTRLHVGVVSSDMGVSGAQPQKSCGGLSYEPTEHNPATTTRFQLKPLGDDGLLQTSTLVATDGVWVAPSWGAEPVLMVPARPECASVRLPAGQRFVAFESGGSVDQLARDVSCIATLGKNGCGLEQQFEAALKALTPPDSPITFSGSASMGAPTRGNGTALDPKRQPSGANAGFLRDDAVLVVILISDEEDCSLPDASNQLFDVLNTSVAGEINVRCGISDNQKLLFPVSRYVDGLRALKPAAYRDRIIVASITGMPVRSVLGTDGVARGAAQIQAVLDRPDTAFFSRRNAAGTADEPVPVCISAEGDGSAAPGRRFLDLTKAFGDNGLASSICEASYRPLLAAIVERVAAQLGKL